MVFQRTSIKNGFNHTTTTASQEVINKQEENTKFTLQLFVTDSFRCF